MNRAGLSFPTSKTGTIDRTDRPDAAVVANRSDGAFSSAPIAVDLDRTLLRADTLHEGLVQLLLHKPWMVPLLLAQVIRGKARLKQFVHAHAPIEVETLPVEPELLDYLKEQKRAGRRIGLFSAAHQDIVDACSERFGIFDVAVGSDGIRNLSGAVKLAAIREHLGGEFVYAGDCPADLPIWRQSAASIYVGGSSRLRTHILRTTRMEREVRPSGNRLKTWAFAARIHQWPKNLLVFVPAALSVPVLTVSTVVSFLFAFLALCAFASATYLINDMADVASDRRHRSKKYRPFASGEISLSRGALAVGVLGAVGIALATLIPAQSALMLALYVAISLAYSFRLKSIPLLDVICLGCLFTVRIAIGAAILENSAPYWLYAFSMFFFTSLAFVKRYTELQVTLAEKRTRIIGRRYQAEDLPLVLAAGLGTALCSLVVLLIYLGDNHFDGQLFQNPGWLALAVATIAYWLLRVWMLALRGQMHDDPVVFALKDRESYYLGLMIGLALFLAW